MKKLYLSRLIQTSKSCLVIGFSHYGMYFKPLRSPDSIISLPVYAIKHGGAWISNYIHYKVWDEITYPFLNFNGCTVEV